MTFHFDDQILQGNIEFFHHLTNWLQIITSYYILLYMLNKFYNNQYNL